jgi:hypothetical protein
MHSPPTRRALDRNVREFVEQVLRTGLMLTDVLGRLLDDLPQDAFPGESTGEVLLEMLTGTVRPVAEAAGPDTLEHCTALLGAAADRVAADLQAALERARENA